MTGISEENFRKIQKVKRSYYVTLPIAYVRGFGWDKKRDVIVRRVSNKLLVESAGSRKPASIQLP